MLVYSESHDHSPRDFDKIEIPKYEDKHSRLYFQPNTNPQKAHKNGFRLAIRELKRLNPHLATPPIKGKKDKE